MFKSESLFRISEVCFEPILGPNLRSEITTFGGLNLRISEVQYSEYLRSDLRLGILIGGQEFRPWIGPKGGLFSEYSDLALGWLETSNLRIQDSGFQGLRWW